MQIVAVEELVEYELRRGYEESLVPVLYVVHPQSQRYVLLLQAAMTRGIFFSQVSISRDNKALALSGLLGYTVAGSDDVAVVYEGTAAVQGALVEYRHGPWEDVGLRELAADDPAGHTLVRMAAVLEGFSR